MIELSAGTMVADRYRVEELIGGGVYRATDTRLQQDVALKVGRVDVRAIDHPGVVRILDRSESFVVMEWLPDGSLVDLLFRRGRLDPREAVELTKQVCRTLVQTGAHGNLKPTNVLIDREGRAKLADFAPAPADAREDVRAVGELMQFLFPPALRDTVPCHARYADVGELLAALETPAPPPPPPAPLPRRSADLFIAPVVIIAAAALVEAYFLHLTWRLVSVWMITAAWMLAMLALGSCASLAFGWRLKNGRPAAVLAVVLFGAVIVHTMARTSGLGFVLVVGLLPAAQSFAAGLLVMWLRAGTVTVRAWLTWLAVLPAVGLVLRFDVAYAVQLLVVGLLASALTAAVRANVDGPTSQVPRPTSGS